MTIEEYNKSLKKQGGVCAICRNKETTKRNGKLKSLAVDHNHKTNKNRGLLCYNCNTALGKFKEDISLLYDAIEYLKRYKGIKK